MYMSKWLKENWKHVAINTKLYKQGQGELVIPEINVDLSIGLISTGSKEEFSKLVFHLAPLGIIVDEIDDEYYEGQMLKLRNLLTRELIRSPNSKIAEKYLNVLERRDRAHWAKEAKETKVTAKDAQGSTMDVTFTVVE